MDTYNKAYPTIGCCGIDCGLCPRYYTQGGSVCPGCGGVGFGAKHPSCGYLTCCVSRKALETCADCNDFPCKRFDAEKKELDSFVTHRRVFTNLEAIRKDGMEHFICQQAQRMEILKDFLSGYDDGRSKSFYCIACALLPLANLQEVSERIHSDNIGVEEKSRYKYLRDMLQETADGLAIDLKLRKAIK